MSISVRRFVNLGLCTLLLLTLASTALADSLDQAKAAAAGIKAVLQHFRPWIIDNKGMVTHHTDNQPCVQAWKRMQRGAFSTSSRICSFLSVLSQLSCVSHR